MTAAQMHTSVMSGFGDHVLARMGLMEWTANYALCDGVRHESGAQ